MLKMSGPEISRVKEECFSENVKNYEDSERRETRAVNKYSEALSVVKETRPRMVFGALIEIEKTHLELAQSKQGKILKIK
jgi:rubrerythrin